MRASVCACAGADPPHRCAQASAPSEAAAEPPPWRLGEGDGAPPPPWILDGDAARISEGSKNDDGEGGFAWRPGKDRCTQGIWLWSHPFVFKDSGSHQPVCPRNTRVCVAFGQR